MADVPFLRRLDLIVLRPDATRADLQRWCGEVIAHPCQALCVPGSRVAQAAVLLEEANTRVSALVGFPFGSSETDVKRLEIECGLEAGAGEFDVVINHGWLHDGNDAAVLRELRDLREAAEERPIKAILELGLLSPEEIRRAGQLVQDAEWQFIVTATGCAARPTTAEDLHALREATGPDMGLKAVGGITSLAFAQTLIAAGANRLGVFQLAPFVAEELSEPPV